jgi:adenine-specific DNA-methyltransferase
LIYNKFQVRAAFAYDVQGLFHNDAIFSIPNVPKWLTAILNSSLGWCLTTIYCTQIQNGYQLMAEYFGRIPIAQPSQSQRVKLESLVSKIIQAHESPIGNAGYIAQLEGQINEIVFEMYGVNNARDRALIESVVGSAPVGDEAVAVGDDG